MSRPDSGEVTDSFLHGWPLPEPGSDKESKGRALVVGGTRLTPGAVLLAAEAALRVGAGKVQVVTVESVATQVAIALPEALVVAAPETDAGELAPEALEVILRPARSVDAILLGPGLMDIGTSTLMAQVLQALSEDEDEGKDEGGGEVAVVLDALALALLGGDGRHTLEPFAGRCVLTPNEREVALALGVDEDEVPSDTAEAAALLARRTGAVVSSGGTTTWTVCPDGRRWSDPAGGPGLGTAGSGDVKAGLLLGLLARGVDPDQAACWASHLHARAGERLAARVGTVGFLARELAGEVPALLDELSR